jgi:hypothetical protein
VVRYTRQEDAFRLLQVTKPPKGHRIPIDQVRFTPQTPDEYRQNRAKLYELASIAKKENQEAEIVFKKDHILVDKLPVSDEVAPPTAEDILLRTTSDEYAMQGTQIFSSSIVNEQKSRFQMFAADITSAEEADTAYKAVQRMRVAASATHLISAYRIDDGAMGWRDDGDHAMRRTLHSIMKDGKITNSIYFLARNFGGVHIGKKRFDIMTKLANELKRRIWKIRKAASDKEKRGSSYEGASESENEGGDKNLNKWTRVGPKIAEMEAIVTSDLQLEWDVNEAVTRPRYGNSNHPTEEDYFDANYNDNYERYEQESLNDDHDCTVVNTRLGPMITSTPTLAKSETISTDSEDEQNLDTNSDESVKS